MPECEICKEKTDDQPCGCEKCGRLFAPCCNSLDPDLCIDCYDGDEPDAREQSPEE